MNDDLISRQALYEKTAEWEAQALHMVEVHLHDEDLTEWRKWSAILNERTAFKHDIADAPSAERRGKWIPLDSMDERHDELRCPFCHKDFTVDAYRMCDIGFTAEDLKFCPNCGAKMESAE